MQMAQALYKYPEALVKAPKDLYEAVQIVVALLVPRQMAHAGLA